MPRKNLLDLIPSGKDFDDLHAIIGGSRAYLYAVMNGWGKPPGIALIFKICKVCPKIKASMLRPELSGVR